MTESLHTIIETIPLDVQKRYDYCTPSVKRIRNDERSFVINLILYIMAQTARELSSHIVFLQQLANREQTEILPLNKLEFS